MKDKNKPLVSIGVPVFNGEKGICRALDSLLEQDYPYLEIIISDNASDDATPSICAEYVKKDSRVRYFRSEKNHEIIWNFSRVFELSSGKYFMWAAHDDHREPSFVSACVDKMESCPDAVLCQARTSIFIDGSEDMLCVAGLDSFEGATGLVERYRETLKRFPATVIYGLYRSSAMRKTKMLQKNMATDLAFIQELSIYGSFVQVPETLFTYVGRKKWNSVHREYRASVGKDKKPWWYLPFAVLFLSHCKRVARAPVPFSDKFRLWAVLLGHETGRITMKAMVKAAGPLCPGRWKEKLGRGIYLRWVHNPNMKICREDLFLERIIKPTLGWWR